MGYRGNARVGQKSPTPLARYVVDCCEVVGVNGAKDVRITGVGIRCWAFEVSFLSVPTAGCPVAV